MNATNKVIITKRELKSLIRLYGIKNCFEPLKRIVKERGLVLNYINSDGVPIGKDFKAYFNGLGDLVHENIEARVRNE